MRIRPYERDDLPPVLALCDAEGWPSFSADAERAHRAFTAPGVVTLVVVDDGGALAGFVQMQSDGEIQAHLSLIAVAAGYRRRGLGRELIEAALRRAGGLRVDLLTDSAESFYRALPHLRLAGFRLYPFYSGPDAERLDVVWTDGRRTNEVDG